MKIKLLIISLFIIHIALALFHLNLTPMWDDEASVVWFAKNYNKFGSILGYDGTHLFSYRNGQLINNNLAYNNPPLDIYFTSFIIRFLGESDYIIRLCFTFLGFTSLLFFVASFRIITGKDKVWFAYAATILLLSVNFLLIESNARYYSLNFLFASISLFATLKITKPSNSLLRNISLLALQLIAIYFLFLSHYLAAICWWLMCFFILCQLKVIKLIIKDKFSWISGLMNLVLFLITAQYFIAHQALNRPDMLNEDSTLRKYGKLIEWLFVDLNATNMVPLWVSFLLVILFIFIRKIFSVEFKRMALFSLVFLVAIVLLNPQSTSKSNSFDIRYLYIIFPLLYLWMAYLLKLVHEKGKYGKAISIVLMLLFVNTTLLSCIPSDTPPRWLLPNFIKEKVQPFPTAYSEVIKYINTNFKGRKKILTLPGFHNTVLFRYVPDKIEVTNTLNNSTPIKRSLIDSLGMQCLYIGACKPDYIFQFGTSEKLDGYPFNAKDYKIIDTILIYAYGVDVTRPELYWHSFGPRKIKDKNVEALYIYHN